MKKVLYTLSLIAVLALSLSSCTEEVVKPKDADSTGGAVTTTKGS